MVWSNLALAWAGDPPAALREVHRVLIPGGLLMFSSYGPDTLKELKAAFGAGSAARHVHSFIDMHDLGDMLVASGFAAPVMDMEVITLTYSEVPALLRDLKASGETCAAHDRQRSLMGRRAWERMLASYERERKEGRLPATIEVIYGHAWKGEPRTTVDGRRIIEVELDAKKIAPPCSTRTNEDMMTNRIVRGSGAALLALSGAAEATYQWNLPAPVTRVASEIYNLHLAMMWIILVIFVGVFGVMFYSIYAHRKSVGHKAENFTRTSPSRSSGPSSRS